MELKNILTITLIIGKTLIPYGKCRRMRVRKLGPSGKLYTMGFTF